MIILLCLTVSICSVFVSMVSLAITRVQEQSAKEVIAESVAVSVSSRRVVSLVFFNSEGRNVLVMIDEPTADVMSASMDQLLMTSEVKRGLADYLPKA